MRSKSRDLVRGREFTKVVLCLLLAMTGCEQDLDADEDEGGQPSPPVASDCAGEGQADAKWVQLEYEVLSLVNEVRAQGASCGSRGAFGPAPALKADARLRCAAVRHSQDMAGRNYFDHENPEGESPMDRIRKAGYSGRLVGENIAAGQPSASAVMSGWMKSDGHCANIMKKSYTELGVGYVHASGTKYKHYWTQNFGASSPSN